MVKVLFSHMGNAKNYEESDVYYEGEKIGKAKFSADAILQLLKKEGKEIDLVVVFSPDTKEARGGVEQLEDILREKGINTEVVYFGDIDPHSKKDAIQRANDPDILMRKYIETLRRGVEEGWEIVGVDMSHSFRLSPYYLLTTIAAYPTKHPLDVFIVIFHPQEKHQEIHRLNILQVTETLKQIEYAVRYMNGMLLNRLYGRLIREAAHIRGIDPAELRELGDEKKLVGKLIHNLTLLSIGSLFPEPINPKAPPALEENLITQSLQEIEEYMERDRAKLMEHPILHIFLMHIHNGLKELHRRIIEGGGGLKEVYERFARYALEIGQIHNYYILKVEAEKAFEGKDPQEISDHAIRNSLAHGFFLKEGENGEVKRQAIRAIFKLIKEAREKEG